MCPISSIFLYRQVRSKFDIIPDLSNQGETLSSRSLKWRAFVEKSQSDRSGIWHFSDNFTLLSRIQKNTLKGELSDIFLYTVILAMNSRAFGIKSANGG
jgi:hypothetical protein